MIGFLGWAPKVVEVNSQTLGFIEVDASAGSEVPRNELNTNTNANGGPSRPEPPPLVPAKILPPPPVASPSPNAPPVAKRLPVPPRPAPAVESKGSTPLPPRRSSSTNNTSQRVEHRASMCISFESGMKQYCLILSSIADLDKHCHKILQNEFFDPCEKVVQDKLLELQVKSLFY